MRKDVSDLKRIVFGMIQGTRDRGQETREFTENEIQNENFNQQPLVIRHSPSVHEEPVAHEEVQETLSLEEKEVEMIKKALEKYKGRRNKAAKELGISERTLYRKITRYGIEE